MVCRLAFAIANFFSPCFFLVVLLGCTFVRKEMSYSAVEIGVDGLLSTHNSGMLDGAMNHKTHFLALIDTNFSFSMFLFACFVWLYIR